MAIRVLLCDDHPVMRDAIRIVLEDIADIEVVSDAGSADELLAQLGSVQPDVVLLDINLPDRLGLGVIEEVLEACPVAHIVVLTMHEDLSYLRYALAAGASGYLLKESAGEILPTAIRAVYEGRQYVDAQFSACTA